MDTEPKPDATEEPLRPEEQDLISTLEKFEGRKLTQQEQALAIDQARAVGDL
jgi:hypothetical protein